MITIDRHISRLISRHDCVIVPGFGAFLAQRLPAYYNADDKLYLPPRRTLVFTPHVTMDDALLSTAYMEDYGISHNQATILMQDDVRKLKNELSRKGKVYLGDLGVLSMNIDGVVSFDASENGVDDPENHGFIPLPIPMMSHKKEQVISIPINRNRIAQYVALAAAIIIMFIFVTPLSDHTFKNDTKASLGSFASPEQISMMQQVGAPAPVAATADSKCKIQPIGQSASNQVVEAPVTSDEVTQAIAVETTEPVVEQQQVVTSQMHHIIVASTPNSDKAQLAISELSAKASMDYNVVQCGKRFRISAGVYATLQEAQEALAAVQANFPDAWIYTN
jgi:hypothetical protein